MSPTNRTWHPITLKKNPTEISEILQLITILSAAKVEKSENEFEKIDQKCFEIIMRYMRAPLH